MKIASFSTTGTSSIKPMEIPFHDNNTNYAGMFPTWKKPEIEIFLLCPLFINVSDFMCWNCLINSLWSSDAI